MFALPKPRSVKAQRQWLFSLLTLTALITNFETKNGTNAIIPQPLPAWFMALFLCQPFDFPMDGWNQPHGDPAGCRAPQCCHFPPLHPQVKPLQARDSTPHPSGHSWAEALVFCREK